MEQEVWVKCHLMILRLIVLFLIPSWDEWVPENRVLKYNEANVQRQKEVHKVHSTGSAKNKKGAVATIGKCSIFV